MIQDLFELVGKIRVDTSGLDSALSEAKGKVEGVGQSFTDVGKSMSKVGGSMTKKLTLPIVAVGVAAVKVGADFEQGMSKVQAMTQASSKELSEMESLARDLGKSTAFSAKEAADGMSFLAMA